MKTQYRIIKVEGFYNPYYIVERKRWWYPFWNKVDTGVTFDGACDIVKRMKHKQAKEIVKVFK